MVVGSTKVWGVERDYEGCVQVGVPISLRACYVMSGADLAHGAISLRDCYVLSGTDASYDAVCLRACYVLSGTDIA
eukprot:1923228-Rhodomonas_salina.2